MSDRLTKWQKDWMECLADLEMSAEEKGYKPKECIHVDKNGVAHRNWDDEFGAYDRKEANEV
jgi:hypothetical protein